MKQWFSPKMQALSGHATRHLAPRLGSGYPWWYVLEYPKAGGTWLSRMVADYLRLPFPQHSRLPTMFSCVIHGHWKHTPGLNNVFYLARDGRDTMVSLYFMRMKAVERQKFSSDARHKRTYESLFGVGFDPADIQTNLPKFIEHEMKNPRDCRVSWPNHVETWWQPDDPGIACLKYEELLTDPVETLARCFEKFTDQPADRDELAITVDRFSFQKMTGRKPGSEDKSSFLRKGIAGDWVNHFSPDAVDVFNRYAGSALTELGYTTPTV
ncbi:MAG: sulfotransferase domain-containing protein [Planctomycetota bacterium]